LSVAAAAAVGCQALDGEESSIEASRRQYRAVQDSRPACDVPRRPEKLAGACNGQQHLFAGWFPASRDVT